MTAPYAPMPLAGPAEESAEAGYRSPPPARRTERSMGAALPPVPTTWRGYFLPGQLPSFLEATLDDLMEEHGSQAVSARVLGEGELPMAPLTGSLGLDVELALDHLTTEMAHVRAMGLTLSDALAHAPHRTLSQPAAARLDAVFACMERILTHFGDGMLTGSAQSELLAFLNEAELLLDAPHGVPRPMPAYSSRAWRTTLEALTRLVLTTIPD